MMLSPPPHAILWDLDGTLVDTEQQSARALKNVLARGLSIEINESDAEYMIGRSWVDIHKRLAINYPKMKWNMATLIEAVAQERETLIATDGCTILEGALGSVERMKRWPMAVVTGSSRAEAAQALRAMRLEGTFSVVLAAEDVSTSKPSPEGYLCAARRLAVDPRYCVVIEDSSAGIDAGRAAGCRVAAVRHGNFADQDQSRAHVAIDSLEDLSAEFVAGLFE